MRIFILLLSFLVASFVACTDFEDSAENQQEIQEYPDQESWNYRMSFTKQGKRRAVLEAGYIAKYTKKNITLLKEGVSVDFFDEYGEKKSHLTSKEGKVFDTNQNMIAIGDVVVISKTGTHLYTEELIWDNEKERIISNVPVKITTETDTLFGDAFSSDPDLINYEITNARGTTEKTISIED